MTLIIGWDRNIYLLSDLISYLTPLAAAPLPPHNKGKRKRNEKEKEREVEEGSALDHRPSLFETLLTLVTIEYSSSMPSESQAHVQHAIFA